jgi:hypothetical protein
VRNKKGQNEKKLNMRRSGAGRREDRQGAMWGWAGARKRGGGGYLLGTRLHNGLSGIHIYNISYVHI